MWKPGDKIVYLAAKHSSRPAPRAVEIRPEPHGEHYSYDVPKYWVIAQVREDGQILACTRRRKYRLIQQDDPRLRRARWWEVWLWSDRFPAWPLSAAESADLEKMRVKRRPSDFSDDERFEVTTIQTQYDR